MPLYAAMCRWLELALRVALEARCVSTCVAPA
jgi:hypothetical protein